MKSELSTRFSALKAHFSGVGSRESLESGLRAAWFIVCAVPAIYAIWYASAFTLSVPFADQWGLLQFYTKVRHHEATLTDWVRPHHGLHIIVFGRLVLGLVALVTGLSYRAECVVNLVLVLVTAASLELLVRRTHHRPRSGEVAVASGLSIAILFSPSGALVWTWSVGFFHFVENACVVGAVVALCTARPRLLLAGALCAVACFNRFEGMVSWLVMVPLVIRASRLARRPRWVLAGWAAAATATCAICLGSVLTFATATSDPVAVSTATVGARVVFGTTLVGAPLTALTEPNTHPVNIHSMVGTLLSLFFVGAAALAMARPAARERALPWVTIGAFGVAFVAAASVGRAVVVGGALNSFQRIILIYYLSAFSITASLISIATVHLVSICWSDGSQGRWAPRLFFVLVSSSLSWGYGRAVPWLRERRADSTADRYCVELAAYMTAVNGCAMTPQDVELIDRSGLRPILHDVKFQEEPGDGRVDSKVNKIAYGLVVRGSAKLSDPGGGTVLLEAGDSRRFIAQAARVTSRRDGVRWMIRVPKTVLETNPGPLHAWIYERDAHRFRRVDWQQDL